MSTRSLIYIFVIFIFCLSCTKKIEEKSVIKETNLELQMIEAYQAGLEELKKGDALFAAKKFNEAEILFPQSDVAPRAALMAAYSYYSQSYYEDDLTDVYNSRTYCLFEDIEFIKKNGLAKGGSLDNAIVVKGKEILNSEGLRNEKEFVNHKILDCIGDLYTTGYRIVASVKCSQGGHYLTNQLLRKVFAKKEKFKNLMIYDAINKIFIKNRILAPTLYNENYNKHFIEIQDFGNQTIFKLLSKKNSNKLNYFKKVIKLLNRIQLIKDTKVRNFKKKVLLEPGNLMRDIMER